MLKYLLNSRNNTQKFRKEREKLMYNGVRITWLHSAVCN